MNPIAQSIAAIRKLLVLDGSSVAEPPLQVLNRTRGTVLATRMETAGSGPSRRKGLLGRDRFEPGEGLWIVPCESVHTFFMRFPIDLVYLDRQRHVRKLRNAVGPWRLSACFSAHSVIELPAGSIRAARTEPGDALEFSPAPQD
ncbi:MAG: DUF192 domain-containing protein [Terracidiphilus sp.]